MSRRNGRIIAFQALFSWETNKDSLNDILSFSWLEKENGLSQTEAAKEERLFASLIISGTTDNIAEIDKMIKKHLSESWSLERINKISLAILRISIYEMIYQKTVEPKIIIDEAVNIAKIYGIDDSYKFINAVLDKISNEC